MSVKKIGDFVRGTAALPLAYANIKDLERRGYALETIARRSDLPVDLVVGFTRFADGLISGKYAISPEEVRACEQINRALSHSDAEDEAGGEPALPDR